MKIILIFTVVLLLLTSCSNLEKTQETEEVKIIEEKAEEKEINFQNTPAKKGDLIATMKTTKWDIVIKLFSEKAPFTVNNFIAHSQDWYYDNLIFHRVINGFMIQGWDPTGTWMWGESIYGEKFNDEFSDDLTNIKYSLSMANSGENTNGSQFFINQNNNSHLNNKHSVFWQVIQWENIVDKIVKVEVWEQSKPLKEIKILSIKIEKFEEKKEYKLNKEDAINKYKDKIETEKNAKKNLVSKIGDTISVHYTLKWKDWIVKESSLNNWKPFTFTIGNKMVIRAWDEKLIGYKIGDKIKLEVEPKDAYGPEMIKVPKEIIASEMWTGILLKKWEFLEIEWQKIEILDDDEKTITVKNNHPLAGEKIFFDIEIVDIKNNKK